MILVLLGTQNNDFRRLLDEVEKNIIDGTIKEEVIVQAGFTKYNSSNMKIFNLTSKENLEKLIAKADLIISHSGVGSLEMALGKGKKVIAIPRKKEYGEHVNNHQMDITKEFVKRGWIMGLEDVKELKDALKRAAFFKPAKYEFRNNGNMIKVIEDFIN